MKLVADLSNLVTKLCSCKKQTEYFCCAVRKSAFDAHNKKEAILRVTSSQQLGQGSEGLGDPCGNPTEAGAGSPCWAAGMWLRAVTTSSAALCELYSGVRPAKASVQIQLHHQKALCFPGGSGFNFMSTQKFTGVFQTVLLKQLFVPMRYFGSYTCTTLYA